MKRKLLMAVIAAAVLGSSMTVCAAPQYMADGNVFDAEWYLEQNPDVKANWSLGTSTDAVYKHYTMYGASEGRKPYDAATFDSTKIQPSTDQSTTPAQSESTTPVVTRNTGTLPFEYTPPAPGTMLVVPDSVNKTDTGYAFRNYTDSVMGPYYAFSVLEDVADTIVVYDTSTGLFYPLVSFKTQLTETAVATKFIFGNGVADLNTAVGMAEKQSNLRIQCTFRTLDTSYFFLYKNGAQTAMFSSQDAFNYLWSDSSRY